jgi:hypothetical protein
MTRKKRIGSPSRTLLRNLTARIYSALHRFACGPLTRRRRGPGYSACRSGRVQDPLCRPRAAREQQFSCALPRSALIYLRHQQGPAGSSPRPPPSKQDTHRLAGVIVGQVLGPLCQGSSHQYPPPIQCSPCVRSPKFLPFRHPDTRMAPTMSRGHCLFGPPSQTT